MRVLKNKYSVLLLFCLIFLLSCEKGYEYKYHIGVLVEYRNLSTGHFLLKDLPIYQKDKQVSIKETDKKYVEYKFKNQHDMHKIYSVCDLLGYEDGSAMFYFSGTEEFDISAPKHIRSYQIELKLPTIFGNKQIETFQVAYDVKNRKGTPLQAKYKGKILKSCPKENTSEIDALYRSGKAFAIFSTTTFIKFVIPVDTVITKQK